PTPTPSPTISNGATATQILTEGQSMTVTSSGNITIDGSGPAITNQTDANIGDILIEGPLATNGSINSNSQVIRLVGTDENPSTAGDITINSAVTSNNSQGIYLDNYASGNISIGASGTLSASTSAIDVVNNGLVDGVITNDGTISSQDSAISLGNTFSGIIGNNGTIYGPNDAISGGKAEASIDNSGQIVGNISSWGGSLNNTGVWTLKNNSSTNAPATTGIPAAATISNGLVSTGTLNIAVTGTANAGVDYSSIATTTSQLSGIINIDVNSSADLTDGAVLTLIEGTGGANLGPLTINHNASGYSFQARVASNGQNVELILIADTPPALPSPVTKQAVTETVKSAIKISGETPKMAMSQVNTRLSWLGRRISIGSPELSYQGIDIRFTDDRIQQLLFGDYSKRSLPSLERAAVRAAEYVQQPDRMKADARALAEDEALNQLSAVRDDTVGSVKPTYASDSKVAGWSWWTMGTVTVGDQDATSDSPGMEITSEYITLGLDGPTDSLGIVGASITLGQNETTIGSDGSEVAHKNYVFTLYNSIALTETFSLRSTLGGTYFAFDTIRIDGSQSLTGDRYGKQGFFSAEVREEGYTFDLGRPVDFEWYVKTDMAHTKLQDYSERGGSLALYFDNHETNTGHLRFGIDAESRFETENGPLIPYAGLEYAMNYSPASTANIRYLSESTIYSQEIERAYDSEWTLELGLDYYVKDLRFGFSYQRNEQINAGYSDSITFGVEGKF
ncbi:autotransporter domain-containing protein, partial [Litoricolaceae bacterium]|nr:autotransporter domain-containing protein [Litorivicinaceae bacterium]